MSGMSRYQKMLFGALVLTVIVSFSLAIKLHQDEIQEVKDLCKTLNAQYVSQPERLCIRGEDVVYQDKHK